MYLGTADPMLQVARYKNNADVTRAAAHRISKTAADQRADDRNLRRRSSLHVPAFGRLTELLLPKRAVSQSPNARTRARSGTPAQV
jgi:hypothetical protein